jgi:hypothetical protein
MSWDWDVFFRVWAVSGPLLSAAATQIWLRRTQLQDRSFEATQEQTRGDRAARREQEIWERERRAREQEDKRTAYARFMASTHEYVRKQSKEITNPGVPGAAEAAAAANDEMVRSSQLVMLLGSAEVAEAAVELWNRTLEIPKDYKVPIDAAYTQRLEVYKAARARFNDRARTDLTR